MRIFTVLSIAQSHEVMLRLINPCVLYNCHQKGLLYQLDNREIHTHFYFSHNLSINECHERGRNPPPNYGLVCFTSEKNLNIFSNSSIS